MSLRELITALEAADPRLVLPDGFTNPHSYRGDYYDLAFEPAQNVPVAEMLADARSALDETFEGWKGGDFVMREDTTCWLAEEGSAADSDMLGPLLVKLMLAAGRIPSDPEAEPDAFGGLDPVALAKRIVIAETEGIDFGGIGEQIEGWHPDEVEAMPVEDFEKLHRLVDKLAVRATVTVEIPEGEVSA